MADIEPKPEPPARVKATRAEIREALTCPICKTPGAMLGDRCTNCGAWQNEQGEWQVPKLKTKESQNGAKKNRWLEWD